MSSRAREQIFEFSRSFNSAPALRWCYRFRCWLLPATTFFFHTNDGNLFPYFTLLFIIIVRRQNSSSSDAGGETASARAQICGRRRKIFFLKIFSEKSSSSCGLPLKCAWSVWNDNQIFTWRQWLNSPGRNLLVDFHKRNIHVYNNSHICVTRSTARQFNKTTQFTMSYTAKMFVCTIFFCYFYFPPTPHFSHSIDIPSHNNNFFW